MLKTDLAELIRNGENSGVEFKRDDVHPDSLAKEMAALLNLEGGHILLGVEDDGTVSGLTRTPADAEEWVMAVCRDDIQPAIIPYWETIPYDAFGIVGVITLPADSPDKPYKARRGSAWITFVRLGATSRDATREQEARLYQASGLVRYDIRPVPGATLEDLDLDRIEAYFRCVREQATPERADPEAWRNLLVNTELLIQDRDRLIPTAGAILSFGHRPNRFLPQAGISAAAYPGNEKDYAARERAVLRGPLAPLLSPTGKRLENGLVEEAMDFVHRNIGVDAHIDEGGRRIERREYPLEAVREAVVNAIVHRDYTIAVTDIELAIYSDRLEVISPGNLPNTVTVEKMKMGYRAARNELLREIFRDYRYIEASGMGIPRKIIRGMREHNGTEPDLIETEDRFTVRLWKAPRA